MQYPRYVFAETLRDGTEVTVRAAGANDGPKIRRAFLNLERDTVYTRGFEHGKPTRVSKSLTAGTWVRSPVGRNSKVARASGLVSWGSLSEQDAPSGSVHAGVRRLQAIDR